MTPRLEFPEGWGFNLKKLLWGGVWIFSGTTVCHRQLFVFLSLSFVAGPVGGSEGLHEQLGIYSISNWDNSENIARNMYLWDNEPNTILINILVKSCRKTESILLFARVNCRNTKIIKMLFMEMVLLNSDAIWNCFQLSFPWWGPWSAGWALKIWLEGLRKSPFNLAFAWMAQYTLWENNITNTCLFGNIN